MQAADVVASDGPPIGSIVEVQDPIEGSYLVLFRDAPEALADTPAGTSAQVDAAQAKVDAVMAGVTGEVTHVYRGVLSGFAVEGLTEDEAGVLASHPAVAFVEQDQVTTASQANPPSWGLDRVDQRNASLDRNYNSFGRTGAGVNVFVLDTGIRSSHQDFGGRVRGSVNFVGDGIGGDCDGHGTHVAGTAAGASYGIAKGANIWDVKVLNCRGEGSTAGIAAALDWVRVNRSGPSVVNMSIGTNGAVPSLDMATEQLVGSGVVVVASSGNENTDACNSSPARAPSALTVGATDRNDRRPSYSNYGSCVDLFAPGDGIRSAAHTSDTGSVLESGTSMAAPHVAGVAALFLGSNPNATPAQVEQAIESAATPGVVSDARSANLLLYTGLPDTPAGPPEVGNPGGTWTQCATEGGTCSFSGTKVVQYG
ncbi:MAG: S8 family peptidase, partial [Actinomycetota bacterium]